MDTDRMAVCCDGGLLPLVFSIWVSVQTQTEWLYVVMEVFNLFSIWVTVWTQTEWLCVVMEVFNLFTIWVTVWTDRMAVCCDGSLLPV